VTSYERLHRYPWPVISGVLDQLELSTHVAKALPRPGTITNSPMLSMPFKWYTSCLGPPINRPPGGGFWL
jgi:hypothetical protein